MTSPGHDGLFVEIQKFRQWWLWVLLVGSTAVPAAVVAWGLYQQLVMGEPWGDRPMSDTGLMWFGCGVTVLTVGVLTLLWTASLRVVVDGRGLRVRYVPFHWSMQPIPLDDVTSIEAVTYSPLLDYGGWGIRYGRKGKAYNVSGNRGVLLRFATGKTLLLGSRHPEELAADR